MARTKFTSPILFLLTCVICLTWTARLHADAQQRQHAAVRLAARIDSPVLLQPVECPPTMAVQQWAQLGVPECQLFQATTTKQTTWFDSWDLTSWFTQPLGNAPVFPKRPKPTLRPSLTPLWAVSLQVRPTDWLPVMEITQAVSRIPDQLEQTIARRLAPFAGDSAWEVPSSLAVVVAWPKADVVGAELDWRSNIILVTLPAADEPASLSGEGAYWDYYAACDYWDVHFDQVHQNVSTLVAQIHEQLEWDRLTAAVTVANSTSEKSAAPDAKVSPGPMLPWVIRAAEKAIDALELETWSQQDYYDVLIPIQPVYRDVGLSR